MTCEDGRGEGVLQGATWKRRFQATAKVKGTASMLEDSQRDCVKGEEEELESPQDVPASS